MKRSRLKKRLKRVAYRFIPPESDVGQPLYALLRELARAHHEAIASARIALAWQLTWKSDVDGRVTLGQCKKVSDLDRELSDGAYDFVVILRRDFWDDRYVTDLQRRALLDHELCHCAVKLDEHGEPAVDECGRVVYRLKKHDLEEFAAIADRYGCWKRDLAEFARALERAREKTSGVYLGSQTLHEQLCHAGLSVPLDVIVQWSDAERRDASTWALLQSDRRGQGGSSAAAMPAHVAAAVTPELRQDTLPPMPPGGFVLTEEHHEQPGGQGSS